MLSDVKNIFIVGIKGVGMANLTLILKKMGKNVSGADVEEEFITDEWLRKNNIPITIGFDNLPQNVDLVIYSAAHGGSQNPLVLEARKRNIQVAHQAQFIGKLMKQFKTTIAVAGSHGKTTTTALLAYALIKLGAKPTYLAGSSGFNEYPAGDFSSTDYFVVEADEYAVDPPRDKTSKFKFLHPDFILCTNIDFDHPDVFSDLKDVQRTFSSFFKQGKKIIRADELKVEDITVSTQGTSFTFKNLGTFQIALFGEKNALNAAGVITILQELGFDMDQIKKVVKDFTGAKRRFEQKFLLNDIHLFDDYAHHPEEIKSTIAAARRRFPNKRIIIIFQPHTYSRTQALLSEFSRALALADSAFIMPIFPSARENPAEFTVTSADIVKNSNLKAVRSKQELLTKLKSNIKSGDIIFTMGAGDVYKLETDIVEIIRKL